VSSTITVGRFATMTHLSVKTLRYYHEVGLLEPRHIDPHSGYRHYSVDQVADAQLIRRLRDLRMPIADVRAVLLAQSLPERDSLLRAHLDHLEQELDSTRAAVNSLRAFLDIGDALTAGVVRRTEPAQLALAISTTIDADNVLNWWNATLNDLRALIRTERLHPTGPICGIYDEALFRHEQGTATLFVPLNDPPGQYQAHPMVIPQIDAVVATHLGSPQDIDLAYSRLGCYIAQHSLTARPEIHEYYLRDAAHTADEHQWITEIAWPITDPDNCNDTDGNPSGA
jgi:DNA-binding transcriptional MerR regulator